MENIDFDLIGIEYERLKLVKLFSRFCSDMKNDEKNMKVRFFYRNSTNELATTKSIFERYYGIKLDDNDACEMYKLINAHLHKQPKRANIPNSVKIELKNQQDNKCAICGKYLGDDLSLIHVDHIIPWELVGDELPDNYQDLCSNCNLEKSNQVDYVFRKKIESI